MGAWGLNPEYSPSTSWRQNQPVHSQLVWGQAFPAAVQPKHPPVARDTHGQAGHEVPRAETMSLWQELVRSYYPVSQSWGRSNGSTFPPCCPRVPHVWRLRQVPRCTQKREKRQLSPSLSPQRGAPYISTAVDPAILKDRAVGAPKYPVSSGDSGISHATVAWHCS